MSIENDLDFFLNNPLFSGLSKSSLKALHSISLDVYLKKGECLMKEGEDPHEIFFILEGVLEVVKCDQETQTNYTINYLYPEDSVGELTLFDKTRRSASIYAMTDARLLKISSKDLKKLSDQKKDVAAIYFELSERTSQRLRKTTEMAAVALKKQVEEYKNRASIGQVFVYSIMLLSLFAFSTLPLKHVLAVITNTAYVSIPMIIALSAVSFFLIRASKLPLYVFGITMRDWKKSIFEGFFFTLPILVLILIAKWCAIHFIPKFHSDQLFEPFSFSGKQTLSVWLLVQFMYCLFVPIQELMARGVLQGMLERLLTGKRRVMSAIFTANLIFSAAHIFLAEAVAITVFIVGLYLGWLYSRTHNLLGVILAHCLVGVWGLSIVGLHISR